MFYQHTHTHTYTYIHTNTCDAFFYSLSHSQDQIFFRTPLRERNFIRRGNVDTDKIDIKLKGCSSNFFFFFTRSPFRSNQQTKNKNDVTRSQNTLYINSKYICFGLLRSVPTTHGIQNTGHRTNLFFKGRKNVCCLPLHPHPHDVFFNSLSALSSSFFILLNACLLFFLKPCLVGTLFHFF